MINKTIHYCWFGSEMPLLYQECIKTWEKNLTSFSIQRWDETNLPKEAELAWHYIKNKQYAFASDYARLYLLERYGGIYMDADFEVIKDFTPLLDSQVFLGYEKDDRPTNGIMGATVGAKFLNVALRRMEDNHAKGLFEISPEVTAYALQQIDKNSYTIYPKQYFYPYNPYDDSSLAFFMYKSVTSDTYAVHHWAKGWKLPLWKRIARKMRLLLK